MMVCRPEAVVVIQIEVSLMAITLSLKITEIATKSQRSSRCNGSWREPPRTWTHRHKLLTRLNYKKLGKMAVNTLKTRRRSWEMWMVRPKMSLELMPTAMEAIGVEEEDEMRPATTTVEDDAASMNIFCSCCFKEVFCVTFSTIFYECLFLFFRCFIDDISTKSSLRLWFSVFILRVLLFFF